MDDTQPSTLLKGFGAIPPTHRPEDFNEVRNAFEQAVADEVMAKIKAPYTSDKTATKEQA